MTEYDAVVVGSGAGGGMAAFVLANSGIKTLMVEAGRLYDPISETPMFSWPMEAPLRAIGTPDKSHGYYSATINAGHIIPGEPYANAEGSDFEWYRTRMLGGRTNHWARVTPRFGPYDFKPYSRDGLGFDWPVTYEDIAPYYDKTESLIGVFGTNEEIENVPSSPLGVLQPPPKPRAYELFVKAGCESLGLPCIPTHAAILTQPLNGRSACFYATACTRGCSIGAAFHSITVLLQPALKSGNLNIRPNAMVFEVTLDHHGRANGVNYIDTNTGKQEHVKTRIVVLAASACETARILLNSKSTLSPEGVANSSGQVGRNLTDTTNNGLTAQFPGLESRPSYNEDGAWVPHLYIPWWGDQLQARGELDFPRGYNIHFGGDRSATPNSNIGEIAYLAGGYGVQLKQDIRRYYGSFINFHALGEMIPNENCYCELDPNLKDKWGIPVLRFHWKWSNYEIDQGKHMQKTMLALIERLGGKALVKKDSQASILNKPGLGYHEVGTTRMGQDPATSVVNQYGQAWDVPNLFITDGGVFASHPSKNPTLTILALAWRSSEFVVESLKRGEN